VASIKREQLAGMNQHYKKYSFDYFLEAQQRAGFDNIELWLGAPHFWLDSMSYSDCKAIRKKVTGYGLKIVSVTSPSIAYQYQYCSQEPYHFERSLGYFTNGIKATAELGAGIMTINSGWGYWGEESSAAFNRTIDTISRLCEIAAAEGVILALESLTTAESKIVDDVHAAKKMYETIHHPALRMMLDTVAAGYAGETASDWLAAFGKDLIHMHFIDGDGCTDAHYIWGDGKFKLESELQCLNDYNYTGYLVQEIVDEKYFYDPAAADLENMKALSRYFTG